MAIEDNLVAAWDFASSDLTDAVNSIALTLDGATFSGGGLLCDANDERAAALAPAVLEIGSWPITIAVYFDLIGTPTNGAGIFGVNYSVPESSPFFGYALDTNTGPVARSWFNSSGSFNSLSGATTLSGTGISLMLTFTANRREIWLNGVSDANDTVPWVSAPVYTASSEVFVGAYMDGLTRNPNVRVRQAYIWNADKTADVAAFAADPDGSTWAPWSAPAVGDVISSTSGTTNGSGVSTITFESDVVAGAGVFVPVTATAGGITKTVCLRPV